MHDRVFQSRHLIRPNVYVTDCCRNIVWKSERDDVDEFNVEFREISLSAIATAPDVCSERACLYLQLDRDDGDEVDNDVYFAVEADEELERLFKSMCDGALRNPDSEEEEEGQSNLFYDMGEVMAGSFDPTVQDDYDDLVGDDPERFENNDEEENT